ncbi:hypothetical protein AB07_1771 [Citrobacter freundii]|nr:hypothetical protein AB07_1771 [Citrobacter freundii]
MNRTALLCANAGLSADKCHLLYILMVKNIVNINVQPL